MKKLLPVTGQDLNEYAEAFNRAYAELSGFEITEIEKIAPLETLIHYEAPDEVDRHEEACDYSVRLAEDGKYITVSLLVGDYESRYCCECNNLEWGRGCPYRSGHIKPMDPACPMFDITIARGVLK